MLILRSQGKASIILFFVVMFLWGWKNGFACKGSAKQFFVIYEHKISPARNFETKLEHRSSLPSFWGRKTMPLNLYWDRILQNTETNF